MSRDILREFENKVKEAGFNNCWKGVKNKNGGRVVEEKITEEELKQKVVAKYSIFNDLKESEKLEKAVIDLYDTNKKFKKDLDKIDFIKTNTFYIGTGFTEDNIPFLLFESSDDDTVPLCFCVYWDGKALRGYIPTNGNLFNKDSKEGYGHDDWGDSKDFVYNRLKMKVKDIDLDELDDSDIISFWLFLSENMQLNMDLIKQDISARLEYTDYDEDIDLEKDEVSNSTIEENLRCYKENLELDVASYDESKEELVLSKGGIYIKIRKTNLEGQIVDIHRKGNTDDYLNLDGPVCAMIIQDGRETVEYSNQGGMMVNDVSDKGILVYYYTGTDVSKNVSTVFMKRMQGFGPRYVTSQLYEVTSHHKLTDCWIIEGSYEHYDGNPILILGPGSLREIINRNYSAINSSFEENLILTKYYPDVRPVNEHGLPGLTPDNIKDLKYKMLRDNLYNGVKKRNGKPEASKSEDIEEYERVCELIEQAMNSDGSFDLWTGIKPRSGGRKVTDIDLDLSSILRNRLAEELDEEDYNDISDNFSDMMECYLHLLFYSPKVEKDLSKISVDYENTLWNGIYKTGQGIEYALFQIGGDWQIPVYVCMYWDGKNLRAYIPAMGNLYNATDKQAYGDDRDNDALDFLKRLGIKHNLTNTDLLEEIYSKYMYDGLEADVNAIHNDIDCRLEYTKAEVNKF